MSRLKLNKILFCLSFSLSLNFLFAEKYIERNLLPQPLSSNPMLLKYLKSVDSVTKYCTKNIADIDIHLAYGLFLVIVNYELAIKDYNRKIPGGIKKRLKNVIDKLKDAIKRYKDLRLETMDREYRQIIKLFSNSTLWVQQVKKLKHTKHEEYTMEELIDRYSPWKDYLKDVEDINFGKPSPALSDMCMVSLSINPTNYKKSLSWCTIADVCYSIFYTGSNFGYALCHRILIFQMAHYGRACKILSEEEDDSLVDTFCKMAYAEAEYIARNNYGQEDLMMEIICICSMSGYGEFLDPIWLEYLLHFQSNKGCFGQRSGRRSTNESLVWRGPGFRRRKRRHVCNSHTTGLGAGIYSTAIRYIIQAH